MPNTPVLPFFAHNSSVKAWCVTGFTNIATPVGSAGGGITFDATNFVDGYNLRLDPATQISAVLTQYVSAMKFSFMTPMRDTKYKVFVQVYRYDASISTYAPCLAHAVNSSLYPKTTTSFWVRVGTMSGFIFPAGANRLKNQVGNVSLVNSSLDTLSMGVVVL